MAGRPASVEGRVVPGVVLLAEPGQDRLSRLTSAEGVSFCLTSDCPGVYFSSEWDGYVETGDVAVRVAASAGRGEPCWLAATM